MIYREHPEVGAILHVHAWMDGIAATDINYPCGTAELAGAVADAARRRARSRPTPSIGLRNHGITATGESLERDPRPDRAAPAPPGADDLAVRVDDLVRGALAFAGAALDVALEVRRACARRRSGSARSATPS